MADKDLTPEFFLKQGFEKQSGYGVELYAKDGHTFILRAGTWKYGLIKGKEVKTEDDVKKILY